MTTVDRVNNESSTRHRQVVVAGTFTLDPLKAAFEFWSEELTLALDLTLSPYDQVHQQLLNESSLLRVNTNGLNVILIRVIDWQTKGEENDGIFRSTGNNESALIENTDKFISAVQNIVADLKSPLLIIICPSICPSIGQATVPDGTDILLLLEQQITQQLSTLTNLTVIDIAQIQKQYPVDDYFDPITNSSAHIPFTQLFYSILGTVIVRCLYGMYSPQCKVIMVDADNTLWGGICGELGPQGVVIDANYAQFQQFLVQQVAAGRLVCIVSKNNASDVQAVFEQRSDMQIQSKHITDTVANWLDKSENIKRLAHKLNISLDNIVFLDDDPIICAEVTANCAAVSTFQLPVVTNVRMEYLHQLWSLDHEHFIVNSGDRTSLYHDQQRRDSWRTQTQSMTEFMAGLNLQVHITLIQSSDIDRISELTYRTNQFNITTQRRASAELFRILSTGKLLGSVVRVTDRFGDYGLVGVLLYQLTEVSIVVDTLLLSCRTLGRGVEHQMLAFLGQQAVNANVQHVIVPFYETEKNTPAKEFLYDMGPDFVDDDGINFCLPSHVAAAVKYRPEKTLASSNNANMHSTANLSVDEPEYNNCAEELNSIALYLSNADDIHEAIENSMRVERDASTAYVAPANTTDRKLLDICADVLVVDHLGMNDNFFKLDVHSLLMMQIIARIQDEFNVRLPIQSFFLEPTVTGISDALAAYLVSNETDSLTDLLQGVSDLSGDDLVSVGEEFTSFDFVTPAVAAAPKNIVSEPVALGLREELYPPINTQNQLDITTIGIATGGRPETLQRCLVSYHKNFEKYGRRVNSLIIDDSQSLQVRETYQKLLRELKHNHNIDLTYAGQEELQRYMIDLQATGNIPQSVINFALGKPSNQTLHHSGNRNALLLATVDELIFNPDDDTLGDTSCSPNLSHGLEVTSGVDPSEYWFCPAPTQGTENSMDILAGLSKLLGRKPEEIITVCGNKDQLPAHDVSTEVCRRLTADGAKVSLVFPGLRGDCGWGSPFGYWGEPMGFLLLNEHSHARLTSSEEKFRQYCCSRNILRVVSRPTISDASFSMTTFLGIDNRELQPPFYPSGRATDVFFGWTAWYGLPNSLVGHTPWALVHSPSEKRTFNQGELMRSASAFDIGKVLFACVQSFQWHSDIDDPARRLYQLGLHFSELGALTADEFNEYMTENAVKYNSRFISIMEDRLNNTNETPEYWALELQRYLNLIKRSQTHADYWIPLDLAADASLTTARSLMQKGIFEFGQLLQWWPAMRDAARTLKAEGRNLGTAI